VYDAPTLPIEYHVPLDDILYSHCVRLPPVGLLGAYNALPYCRLEYVIFPGVPIVWVDDDVPLMPGK
jgi:hypothetical protein